MPGAAIRAKRGSDGAAANLKTVWPAGACVLTVTVSAAQRTWPGLRSALLAHYPSRKFTTTQSPVALGQAPVPAGRCVRRYRWSGWRSFASMFDGHRCGARRVGALYRSGGRSGACGGIANPGCSGFLNHIRGQTPTERPCAPRLSMPVGARPPAVTAGRRMYGENGESPIEATDPVGEHRSRRQFCASQSNLPTGLGMLLRPTPREGRRYRVPVRTPRIPEEHDVRAARWDAMNLEMGVTEVPAFLV